VPQAAPAASADPPHVRDARLRARLENPVASLLLATLEEIQRLGPEALGLVHAVVPLLDHKEAEVRQAAAEVLVSMGGDAARPFLDQVLAAYTALGPQAAHSSWAMSWGPYVLAKLGEPAVLPVAEVLGHEDAYFVALVTFQRLSVLGAPTGNATDVVLRRLGEVKAKSPLIFLVDAVPYLGRDARRVVPRLIDLLAEPRREVRFAVVRVLGRIGPDAAVALPELERLRAATGASEGALVKAIDESIAQIRSER
jgi:HEAT repeat protein